MHQQRTEFIALLKKQIDGTITELELIRLEHLSTQISKQEQAELFDEIWQQTIEKDQPSAQPFSTEESDKILQNIFQNDQQPFEIIKREFKYRKLTTWISAAAALLILTLGIRFLTSTDSNQIINIDSIAQNSKTPEDLEPGRNRAVFLTEDGQKITLDSNRVGLIEAGENFSIVQLETGEIQYQTLSSTIVEQHTVQTPRGGQINFLLPDGTKVWLNAESSISFASNLGTADRIVQMTGEVYFEVTKSEGRKFEVAGSFGKIEVLGTKFNVNAYDKKQTTAALLSGAIRLETPTGSLHMQPDQLTTIAENGSMKTVSNANVKKLTLWKDGFFHFDRADVQTIAAQLARWYDIDVVIKGKRKRSEITGTIARNVKLSNMLEMLDYLGLQSTYKNNNLTVNIKNP